MFIQNSRIGLGPLHFVQGEKDAKVSTIVPHHNRLNHPNNNFSIVITIALFAGTVILRLCQLSPSHYNVHKGY